MYNMSYEDYELFLDGNSWGPCNIKGEPVKRDKCSYPYSYDPFVIWKGNYSETDHAVYSDRLMGWDSKKYRDCCKKAFGDKRGTFATHSPCSIEEFLSLYFDEKITLTGIEQGCNYSSGFPFWIFYYKN